MNIPYDFNNIKPIATQVWNCEEIGFYTNGKYNKVIYTYKLIPGERMCKVQIGDLAPFWFTSLVFTHADGK